MTAVSPVSGLKLPPDPRTVAEMIPVREAEITAREAPVCGKGKRHGKMAPRPLAKQTYEQMFCGVGYECAREECSGNAHYLSRELAAYHGEPYVVRDGEYETWDGSAWQPVSQAGFDAYWDKRIAEQERRQAAALARARKSRRGGKRRPAA